MFDSKRGNASARSSAADALGLRHLARPDNDDFLPAKRATHFSDHARRRLWYNAVDCNAPKEEREEALRILELYVEILTTRRMEFPQPFSDIRKIIIKNKDKFLEDVPDKLIVIPILNEGLLYGVTVMEALHESKKEFGYAFMSCSSHTGYQYNFEGGRSVGKAIYMPEPHLDFLRQHSDSPILLVDNCVGRGTTARRVSRHMRRLGFSQMYYLAFRGAPVEEDLRLNKIRFGMFLGTPLLAKIGQEG